MKRIFFAFLFFVGLASCDKTNTLNSYYLLQGNYTGNSYHWQRDYDSSMNVIERFDTTYNISSTLIIDETTNLIKFGGIVYANHEDLKSIATDDTITAWKDFSTRPTNQFRLIKSSKRITISNSIYAPTGPYADQVTEDYYKN